MSTPGVLPTLIEALLAWLGRIRAPHRVWVTIAGDTIELEHASPRQQRALVDAFIRRHAPD